MFFHLDEVVFKKFINDMSEEVNIDADIIEKDYYVCAVLKELSESQDYLKAYFKGGTAVYKILDEMKRFSEDIDLTVEVIKEASNNSNKTRLKKSALGYKIPGLELQKEKTKDVKQSVTAFYKYKTLFEETKKQLHRAGEVQVEATSFTISEPVEIHTIEPILYKYANKKEKEILTKEFEIEPFKIKVQKLERIFIDKLFAAQAYIKKQRYAELSKHLYDLTILFKTERIQKFLNSSKEFKRILTYQRKEEVYRKGGVPSNIQITDFEYFDIEFDEQIIKAFNLMQEKYIFKEEYRTTIDEAKKILQEINKKIGELENGNI